MKLFAFYLVMVFTSIIFAHEEDVEREYKFYKLDDGRIFKCYVSDHGVIDDYSPCTGVDTRKSTFSNYRLIKRKIVGEHFQKEIYWVYLLLEDGKHFKCPDSYMDDENVMCRSLNVLGLEKPYKSIKNKLAK